MRRYGSPGIGPSDASRSPPKWLQEHVPTVNSAEACDEHGGPAEVGQARLHQAATGFRALATAHSRAASAMVSQP